MKRHLIETVLKDILLDCFGNSQYSSFLEVSTTQKDRAVSRQKKKQKTKKSKSDMIHEVFLQVKIKISYSIVGIIS